MVLVNELTVKELVTILCDTGALSANYVAKDLVDKLRRKFGNEAFLKLGTKLFWPTVKRFRTRGREINLILRDQYAHTYKYTGEFSS